MRVGVVGSRYFVDYNQLSTELNKHNISSIVSGGAQGADALAERYADEYQIPITIHRADWRIGSSAGPQRNKLIVDDVEMIIAFLAKDSKGTRDTIKKAKARGIPVVIIDV
jgi:hypothetical protein